jgi:hypothetical protein
MTDFASSDPAMNVQRLENICALTSIDVALIRKNASQPEVVAMHYGIPMEVVTLLRLPAAHGEMQWTKTRDASGVDHLVATGWS